MTANTTNAPTFARTVNLSFARTFFIFRSFDEAPQKESIMDERCIPDYLEQEVAGLIVTLFIKSD